MSELSARSHEGHSLTSRERRYLILFAAMAVVNVVAAINFWWQQRIVEHGLALNRELQQAFDKMADANRRLDKVNQQLWQDNGNLFQVIDRMHKACGNPT